MKHYRVILHPDAEVDIRSGFEWGTRVWGRKRAQAWVQELQRILQDRLASLPLRCPLAPESNELDTPVRHLINNRYRVLFTVVGSTVTVLHVRGPHASSANLK